MAMHPTKEGASWAPSSRSLSRGPGRGTGRWRRRGRGVLELLLGAEQRVERLLAQPLGEREGHAGADHADEQQALEAAAAPLLARGLVQRDAGVPDVARRLLDVLLQLLVVEDLRRGVLPVAEAPVGVAGRLERLHDVLPQVLVLDEPLDVGVGAGLLGRLPGLLHLLVRHRALSSLLRQFPLVPPSIPAAAVL